MKPHYLLTAVCSALLLLLPTASAQTEADLTPGWRSVAVDPNARASRVALAFGAGGRMAAYAVGAEVRFASSEDGIQWRVQVLGTRTGGDVSLTVNPVNGQPGVNWHRDGSLHFAWRSNDGGAEQWVTETVEAGTSRAYATSNSPSSVAFDLSGKPAACYRYYDGKAYSLRFAYRSAATSNSTTPVTWNKERIADTGSYPDLAFHPTDGSAVVICSTSGGPKLLKRGPAGGWQLLNSLLPGEGWDPSVAFDPSGNLYAGYCSADRWCFLKVDPHGAAKSVEVASGWGFETYSVDVAYADGRMVATVWDFDAEGDAYIYTVTIPAVEFQQASLTLVEKEPSLEVPAIAISPDQRVHVSYVANRNPVVSSEDPNYAGPTIAFSDNMENSSKEYPDKPWPADPNGWTTEGNERDRNVTKQNSTPTLGTSDLWKPRFIRYSHPERISFFYGHDVTGGYDTGFRNWGRLKSREIDLTTATRAELAVAEFVHLEGGSFEHGEIQVSTNNGQTWSTISSASRSSGVFQTRSLNLNAFRGQKIRLGFFLDTKNEKWNNYEGWYVDDVRVKVWNLESPIVE